MLGTSRSGGKEKGKNRSRRLDGCLYFKPKAVFEIAWVFLTTFWCFYTNSMRYFVQIQHEFPTAGHLVLWKPYPWVKILKNMVKVARYSVSGSIPPKFEDKLRRQKQSFGKIATAVVLDEDENLLWSGLQRHRSCHSNEVTALGTVLRKSFTVAFSSNSSLDFREV